MITTPRAIMALAVVTLALVPLPVAAADECVEVTTATFSEGMRVIANAGRQIALGFRSGDPGDGVAFVVIITPSVCSGLGLGTGGLSDLNASGDPATTSEWALTQLPPLLPLP